MSNADSLLDQLNALYPQIEAAMYRAEKAEADRDTFAEERDVYQQNATRWETMCMEAEAEVERLRALLPVDGSHMPSIVDLLEDRVKVLEADLAEAERHHVSHHERENALREALDVIATCPPEAVHLMPLAAHAALRGPS